MVGFIYQLFRIRLSVLLIVFCFMLNLVWGCCGCLFHSNLLR
nr:MAG TPA: hypothetical protein [Inoviridae sp.]